MISNVSKYPSWESLTNYGHCSMLCKGETVWCVVVLRSGGGEVWITTGAWWSGSKISIAWLLTTPSIGMSLCLSDRGKSAGYLEHGPRRGTGPGFHDNPSLEQGWRLMCVTQVTRTVWLDCEHKQLTLMVEARSSVSSIHQPRLYKHKYRTRLVHSQWKCYETKPVPIFTLYIHL